MFKRLALLAALVLTALTTADIANAQVYVRGYMRSNGTYVQPHYRSNPDGNFYNNWSSYPNINPYTGRAGTRLSPAYGGSYSTGYRNSGLDRYQGYQNSNYSSYWGQ